MKKLSLWLYLLIITGCQERCTYSSLEGSTPGVLVRGYDQGVEIRIPGKDAKCVTPEAK